MLEPSSAAGQCWAGPTLAQSRLVAVLDDVGVLVLMRWVEQCTAATTLGTGQRWGLADGREQIVERTHLPVAWS
ncbi:hypothetical protein H5U98_28575 [Mycolicibacterium boenickei]|uniref:Uncharacterized protein n=1 Tax=Mycolicibacterium boenickei TaxID=146017 RepID=A0AAX2ZWH0_9MYCO|nr:hypothetical protein [Mycolicibacterium boenickei]UNB99373.1 hypothetical protein H5U98_28575 [Mycolicibacterium boenickei]